MTYLADIQSVAKKPDILKMKTDISLTYENNYDTYMDSK